MRLCLSVFSLAVCIACGTPDFTEPPKPQCPLSAEMKRLAPLVADYAYGLTYIGVRESGDVQDIVISRSLLAHPGGSTSTLLLLDRCETAHTLPALCRSCVSEGNCPSPTQCSLVTCLGDGGTRAETWVQVDGGYEYPANHPDYPEVKLRYGSDPRRLIERTFSGGDANVAVKVADQVLATTASSAVDLSFDGEASGQVRGPALTGFNAKLVLPQLVPGHTAEVRAEQYPTGAGARVSLWLDGEELGLLVTGSSGRAEMAFRGACAEF